MGPDGSSRIAGLNPFPLFDDFRVRLLDEPAYFPERLSPPITQLSDPSVNPFGSGFFASWYRMLHQADSSISPHFDRTSAANGLRITGAPPAPYPPSPS